jgi:hypothetical protein
MRLSKEGQFSWEVPADFAREESLVPILVRDASGRKVSHDFTVQVGAAKR